jgi:hypothetical protein
MRVILAGLFVFAGLTLAITLLSGVIDHVSPILFGSSMGILVVVLTIFALVLFNGPFTKIGNYANQEAHIQDLEEEGLLVSTDFHAVRVFEVEEFEDEGPHYFLELVNGNVLYLNGQYLYDYVPLGNEEDEDIPLKVFPCTEFAVKRHRREGFVVEMICRGHLLEPENMEPTFPREAYRRHKAPKDGDIIADKSFDELKQLIGQPG